MPRHREGAPAVGKFKKRETRRSLALPHCACWPVIGRLAGSRPGFSAVGARSGGFSVEGAEARRLLYGGGMDDQLLLEELHHAIGRLADAVGDDPPTARALRRFADDLPATRPALRSALARRLPRNPSAIKPLLWDALADGVLDARRFDIAMIARGRAARVIEARTTRYSPPIVGSPSDSESSAGPPGIG
jgi:hypothetical protein